MNSFPHNSNNKSDKKYLFYRKILRRINLMQKVTKTMDGNQAAAYASYNFTEVAAIFPITPSTPMGEAVDEWSAHGKKYVQPTSKSCRNAV